MLSAGRRRPSSARGGRPDRHTQEAIHDQGSSMLKAMAALAASAMSSSRRRRRRRRAHRPAPRGRGPDRDGGCPRRADADGVRGRRRPGVRVGLRRRVQPEGRRGASTCSAAAGRQGSRLPAARLRPRGFAGDALPQHRAGDPRLERLGRHRFQKRRVVTTTAPDFGTFNGLAVAPDGLIYVGAAPDGSNPAYSNAFLRSTPPPARSRVSRPGSGSRGSRCSCRGAHSRSSRTSTRTTSARSDHPTTCSRSPLVPTTATRRARRRRARARVTRSRSSSSPRTPRRWASAT